MDNNTRVGFSPKTRVFRVDIAVDEDTNLKLAGPPGLPSSGRVQTIVLLSANIRSSALN